MIRRNDTALVEPGDPDRISDPEFTVNEYIDHFATLVQLEREEEMNRHLDEIRRLSGRQREREGRAILNCSGRKQGYGLGGRVNIKYLRKDGLPETEISVGDLVMISGKNPLSNNNPAGTVIEKTGFSLTISFDNPPPKWAMKRARIDLYVNDITFQRMLEAIKETGSPHINSEPLVERILHEETLSSERIDWIDFVDEDLDNSQREAVKNALGARFFHLIHGPPGTGKTKTCIEVIQQELNLGMTVLACADSNIAVDNLVERLIKRGRKVVRIGHPARVTPGLVEHTLDYLLEQNGTYSSAQKLREKAYELKEKQEQYTYPSGRWRRGLSNTMIQRLAQKGQGTRGIPANVIKGMARALDIKEKIDSLFLEIDEKENEALEEILDRAEVVCSTNSTAGSEALMGKRFDVCVIDECTQSTEPSCLIPAIKSKKIILAGDHKQLPPTILNGEANRRGLSITLFERILALYGDRIKSLLGVQYRMNEKIMRFPDDKFYDNRIIAHQTVKNHTLKDILNVVNHMEPREILDPSKPLALIDTDSRSPERTRAGSPSRENPGEAKIVTELSNKLLRMGLEPRDVGIITPYKDQSDLISSGLKKTGIEINTVDGFQGREKEVIIISFVRSNNKGNVGFLKDLRRLNVSITRARRKLIVVCDVKTISNLRIYRDFVEYVKEEGIVEVA